jgi:DNA-directed RNA polymerase specialized sigma subunit
VDPSALASSADPPDAVLEERERFQALEKALTRLEPRDRMLLALRFKDDQTAIAIARVMGFPSPFHVYRRLNSLLGTLRQVLGDAGVDGLRG